MKNTTTIDSEYSIMERAEIEKSQHRRKQAFIAAAVISCIIAAAIINCIVVLVVGRTESSLRRQQQRKELKMACNAMGRSMKYCKEADYFYNDISASSTIPSELGLLTQMKIIEISGEGVYGTIPSTLGNLVQLTKLSLTMTQLTGTIPSTLADLRQLSFMDLTGNTQLGGTVPLSLCYFSKATILIDCENIACSCCVCCSTYKYGTRGGYERNCSTAN